MPDIGVYGPPGLGSQREASYRRILKSGVYTYLGGGRNISGATSRDSGNTGYLDTLRPGLLMGKVTSTGEYAPSILGVTTAAYTSGGTAITVSAAQAVEIVRRVGSTGDLVFVGPPTANGTNAVSAAKAYSAINTTSGVITTADIGADKVAGSFVVANDGTQLPRTFIPEHAWGVKVTDIAGNNVDVQFAQLPIAGCIDASQLLYWPTDTSLQQWIKDNLNGTGVVTSGAGTGKFVFDSDY